MSSTSTYNLTLNTLQAGLPGITEAWGKLLCEASAYCFECQNHPKGVELKVRGMSTTSFNVFWETIITDQLRSAWNDEQDLTEFGACGIAILLILKLTGFTVIERARKGTGIDYWLGHKNAERPFQNAARLEISGILNGDANAVKTRVNKKIKQTKPSDGTLPAFVVVVEFSEPQSHLVQK
ncbi:MAG: hypothetical protein HYZ49_01100 [Chloroflexi bacterium]|nr:hypothetical protein [Chloroflexota bacterium]